MKSLILAMAVIAISTATVQAQNAAKSTSFSIAGNIGIPTTKGLSLAFGGDLQADFGVGTGLKITASAGYEDYSAKSGYTITGAIPLLAGVKFDLGSNKLYGHAQLGYGISTAKGGGGAFAYAPSIGYNFSHNFDASVKYLAFSRSGATTGSVNLRLAYDF